MAHLTYKPKDMWKPSLSVEERVDLIYAEVIQGVFGDFYSGNGGPGDILIDFGITREEYELICQDSRGGMDCFQERVLDALEAAIKDLSIFNGRPTSDKTIITNIFDVIEFVDGDDEEYQYVFEVGLRRENDD